MDGRPTDLKNLTWQHDLRLWREAIQRRSAELDRLLADTRLRSVVADFTRKATEKGRRRALRHLKELLAPCTAAFQVARLEQDPVAVWATVRALEDGAVNCEYVSIKRDHARRDLWFVRTRPHVAERFFQRNDAGADFTSALAEANLAASKGRLSRQPDRTEVMAPAGAGALIGEIIHGGTGGGYHYLLAETWLHGDMAISDYSRRVVLAPAMESPHPPPIWPPGILLTIDPFASPAEKRRIATNFPGVEFGPR